MKFKDVGIFTIMFILITGSSSFLSCAAEAPGEKKAPVQDQNQLLRNAAFHGNLQGVENALNQGADINTADNIWLTALVFAAIYGHPAIVEMLTNAAEEQAMRMILYNE